MVSTLYHVGVFSIILIVLMQIFVKYLFIKKKPNVIRIKKKTPPMRSLKVGVDHMVIHDGMFIHVGIMNRDIQNDLYNALI